MEKIVTKSEKETIAFAKKFAKTLRGGEVLELSGNLGAGKTTFVKGLAKSLGIKKIITSPTFILMNVYKIKDLRFKIKVLVHIDCYRLKTAQDLLDIGAQEYFGRPDSIVVIEWPEKIKKILPRHAIKISIDSLGREKREIFSNI